MDRKDIEKQYSNDMQQYRINSKTKVLALFGNPAKHSLSPVIQNRFLRDNDIDAVYVTFEFPGEGFDAAFAGAREMGMFGLNITMPYKEKAFEQCENKDRLSLDTFSVNTIRFDHDRTFIKASGFNTDVDGFLISLDKKECRLEDMNCLVIGAGGAARSAVYALLKGRAKRIYIFNRTVDKAVDISNLFNKSTKIEVVKNIEDKSVLNKIDLVCNCTPLGMETGGLEKQLPIPEVWDLGDKVVFETVYKPSETVLLRKAKKEGAVVIDGLDMLINQAASSFNKWFGIFPDTKNIKDMLTGKNPNNIK